VETCEEIEILETENNKLKEKIKELEYDNAIYQVKEEEIWNTIGETN
jgi:hypothetical protein